MSNFNLHSSDSARAVFPLVRTLILRLAAEGELLATIDDRGLSRRARDEAVARLREEIGRDTARALDQIDQLERVSEAASRRPLPPSIDPDIREDDAAYLRAQFGLTSEHCKLVFALVEGHVRSPHEVTGFTPDGVESAVTTIGERLGVRGRFQIRRFALSHGICRHGAEV